MPYPGQTMPVRFHLERSSRPVRRSIIDLLIDSVTFSELWRRQPLVEARTLQDRSGRVCDILDVEVKPLYFLCPKSSVFCTDYGRVRGVATHFLVRLPGFEPGFPAGSAPFDGAWEAGVIDQIVPYTLPREARG